MKGSAGNRLWRPNSAAVLVTVIAIWAMPAAAADGARLFFSRDFPGSLPAYFEVELTAEGHGTYREEPGEEEPLTFQLDSRERTIIFELVGNLDSLRRPIASNRKVAFTGDKVLRYNSGHSKATEVKYTYTEDTDARVLEKWFLRMSESARHLFELERVTQFDRLGVNKALLSFQTSYDKERVVAAHQFLPVLRKIAGGKQFVHIAQARAAALMSRIKEQPE